MGSSKRKNGNSKPSKPANESKSSESDDSNHVLFPLLPLPSAELCLMNSVPLSCLKERDVDARLRLLNFKIHNGQIPPERASVELAKIKVNVKSQSQLVKEEQIMKSLLRYLELGICNKRQIMSITGMDLGPCRDNYIGLKRLSEYETTSCFMASLTRAILACGPQPKVTRCTSDTFYENSLVCLDSSPFSIMNEACGMPRLHDSDTGKRPRIASEDEMFSNLCKGLLKMRTNTYRHVL
ncbi:hypothetical protein BdWA1_002217 [Babesia duncani]|uniref:Uncharacterized protein n=1 Tax=Babesia duncani TaxID=323732 RepID=A0AAD9PLF4_9APIC|nr:hypothetical protein BdWA1_002217 [Babesia duncani]